MIPSSKHPSVNSALPGETAAEDARAEATAELGQVLRRLLLAVDAHVRAVGRASGHPAADIHALGVVKDWHREGVAGTPGSLGRALGLSPAAATALVNRMVASGHAVRSRRGDDGRQVELEVTAEGAEESRMRFQPMNDAYEEALGRFSTEELRAAGEVMAALLGATQGLGEPPA